MSDDAPEMPADNAATLCNALIILTGVMLIGAILVLNGILQNHYPEKAWF